MSKKAALVAAAAIVAEAIESGSKHRSSIGREDVIIDAGSGSSSTGVRSYQWEESSNLLLRRGREDESGTTSSSDATVEVTSSGSALQVEQRWNQRQIQERSSRRKADPAEVWITHKASVSVTSSRTDTESWSPLCSKSRVVAPWGCKCAKRPSQTAGQGATALLDEHTHPVAFSVVPSGTGANQTTVETAARAWRARIATNETDRIVRGDLLVNGGLLIESPNQHEQRH
ncbi:unnamed protein product [Amoebophrya sp. A25]|nr:unnamed protein product [Amoebophrya sp. A25]|eukprot:GSA25T00025530001.1